jgi:hypothetical protein
MKIRLVGAELFHADGQMDGHRHVEAKVDFRILQTWFLNGYKGPHDKNQ